MCVEWNFADVWEAVAQSVPGNVAQVHGERRISWSEFDARANGLAQTLLRVSVYGGTPRWRLTAPSPAL